jgi:hypothetical protein
VCARPGTWRSFPPQYSRLRLFGPAPLPRGNQGTGSAAVGAGVERPRGPGLEKDFTTHLAGLHLPWLRRVLVAVLPMPEYFEVLRTVVRPNAVAVMNIEPGEITERAEVPGDQPVETHALARARRTELHLDVAPVGAPAGKPPRRRVTWGM